jgi:hypothetical protein
MALYTLAGIALLALLVTYPKAMAAFLGLLLFRRLLR